MARCRRNSARPKISRIAPATNTAIAGTSSRQTQAADPMPVPPAIDTATANTQQAIPSTASRRVWSTLVGCDRVTLGGRVSATRSATPGTSPVYASGESTLSTRNDERSV